MLQALLGVLAALLLFTGRSAAEPAPAGAAKAVCGGVLIQVAKGESRCIKPGSGRSFKDCADCPEMVVVPAGRFTMGSPSDEAGRSDKEGPQHKVRIAKPFAVGKFTITIREYFACVKTRACRPPVWDELGSKHNVKTGTDDYYKKLGGALTGADYPVVGVSWNDAQDYVKWLSQKTGKKYRLLSEAEWEYAARAGTQTSYFWGDSAGKNHANCDGCGSRWDARQPAPVGSFPPNAFGLHDMAGNVWQWTEDCWNRSYIGAPGDGSAWRAGSCGLHVIRGGSWDSIAWVVRAAIRGAGGRGFQSNSIGFRCARVLK